MSQNPSAPSWVFTASSIIACTRPPLFQAVRRNFTQPGRSFEASFFLRKLKVISLVTFVTTVASGLQRSLSSAVSEPPV